MSGLPAEFRFYLLALLVLLLALALLLALLRRARRRWAEGREAFEQLKQQSRAMNLQQQGMADSVTEASQKRKPGK